MKRIWLVAALACAAPGRTASAAAKTDQPAPARAGEGVEGPLEAEFPSRPIEQWKGLRFVFLPQRKRDQDLGYPWFYRVNDRNDHPSYQECVGRVGVVADVREERKGYYVVRLQMEDTKEVFETQAPLGTVNGVGPYDDIEKARDKWVNRTLWLRDKVFSTYDPVKDEYGLVAPGRFKPVTVLDVTAGFSDWAPVRFVVRTEDGKEGFVDVTLSGTNADPLTALRQPFRKHFLEQDPRTLHDWPEAVWAALESGKVTVGMTAEQAELSWGTPGDVKRTGRGAGALEKWIYRGGAAELTIRNGVVSTVRERK